MDVYVDPPAVLLRTAVAEWFRKYHPKRRYNNRRIITIIIGFYCYYRVVRLMAVDTREIR